MIDILAIVLIPIYLVIVFVLMYIGLENKKQRLRVSIAIFLYGGFFGLLIGLIAIGFGNPGSLGFSSFLAFGLGLIMVVMINLYWWSQDKWLYSFPRLFQKTLSLLFRKRK